MSLWRAGCGESRTSGSEGGPGKRIGRNTETAPRSDPYIIGKNGASAVGTLVERMTRYLLLLHLPNDHGALAVEEAMRNAMATLPAELARSITWDQGSEMASHLSFTIATGIPVYFCDPHSPWQRCSNENTNGLIRHTFPRAPTCPPTPQATSSPFRGASTDAPERPSAMRCQKRN